MAKIKSLQTTFQAGQIDAKAIGRSDIQLFSQALKNGSNWRLISSGGITRRPGTRRLTDLGESVRLLPFEFDDDDLYIFALRVGYIDVYYLTGLPVTTLTVSELSTQNIVDTCTYVQSGDFMFICHRDMVMQEIQRTSATTFSVSDYVFDRDDNGVDMMPFTKFAGSQTTIQVTGAGPYTLTTSVAHWTSAYATDAVQVKVWDGTGWDVYQISGFTSTTQVTATLMSGSASPVTTKQWLESAYNDVKGWPHAIAFHAGRLYMGGSTNLPAHLAGSKVGLFWNFDTDDGGDDDGIFAPIDSDRINAIRHLVSGHNLQIFTDLSELHISEDEGAPITPSTVSVRANTRYGSSYVRPLVFDDATIFVQRNGGVIREYLWNSLNRGYTSNPLSLISNDMIGVIDEAAIDYGGMEGPEQYAYFLNTDGSMLVYHALRAEQVSGFLPWNHAQVIESICVVGGTLYASIRRTYDGATHWELVKFTEDVWLDTATGYTSVTATDTWTGLDLYANETVHVTAEDNNYYLGEYTVDGSGNLDLSANDYEVSQIWVGYNYTATAETLPINFSLPNGPSNQMVKRIINGFIRVDSSYDFQIEDNVFTPRLIEDDVSSPPTPFTGVKKSYVFGAAIDKTLTVISDVPLPVTVLTMGMEVAV